MNISISRWTQRKYPCLVISFIIWPFVIKHNVSCRFVVSSFMRLVRFFSKVSILSSQLHLRKCCFISEQKLWVMYRKICMAIFLQSKYSDFDCLVVSVKSALRSVVSYYHRIQYCFHIFNQSITIQFCLGFPCLHS